ncbi:MAG TPA: hypothetical protein VL442_19175 [Mucilaginibacter sp.]|jgi:hypothetical protein|nr:hypothetical protein [Mucilaginibacter sp.]
MKFIVTILIGYFCVLIAQPLYRMDMAKGKPGKCGVDMCCKKAIHQTPTKPCGGGACNTDLCNPFVPCSISTASRVIHFKFGNPIFELSLSKKPAVNDHIISNYLSDCWRPPRLS